MGPLAPVSLYGKESTNRLWVTSSLSLWFTLALVHTWITQTPVSRLLWLLCFLKCFLSINLSLYLGAIFPRLEKRPGRRYPCWTPHADGSSCVSTQHEAPAFRANIVSSPKALGSRVHLPRLPSPWDSQRDLDSVPLWNRGHILYFCRCVSLSEESLRLGMVRRGNKTHLP